MATRTGMEQSRRSSASPLVLVNPLHSGLPAVLPLVVDMFCPVLATVAHGDERKNLPVVVFEAYHQDGWMARPKSDVEDDEGQPRMLAAESGVQ
eukprot:m.213816 g.213816  ORF g.213816 m.213816 type:complete len:94 (+) comp16960_c1_seq4:453-734(+)